MLDLDITADELVSALLNLAHSETVCILDSCGVGHLGSHLLIAGIDPVETLELKNRDADETLSLLDRKLSGDTASIFTLSYDFGRKLLDISSSVGSLNSTEATSEPDIFLAQFDVLIVHDYDAGRSFFVGNINKFRAISEKLRSHISNLRFDISDKKLTLSSNFTRAEYLAAIEEIKERIRRGDTYQTNLTQQLTAKLPPDRTPDTIFSRLRRDHPAPFAAFITRKDSTVISASPERFFSIRNCRSPRVSKGETRRLMGEIRSTDDADYALANAGASAPVCKRITTSPIKGTRKRGETTAVDDGLKKELLNSEKDRAENIMIVDLLRNDLGRVCEYGSVEVERLCELEVHPSLFHLVSTVGGDLRPDTSISDILKAVFPCGSITGAPKISTMKIIDEIEPSNRALSMGAIGYSIPDGFEIEAATDLSVAIRTMVVRDQTAVFNVGGGIVIDSDPESEYAETLTKAKALLNAIGAECLEQSYNFEL